MAEDQLEQRTCDFWLVLSWHGGVHTSYYAKEGLKRAFFFKGRIDDRHSWPKEPVSAFHEKPVDLEILSSFHSEWWERTRTRLGVPNACGLVRVRAGVEPKHVESEYGEHEPFEVEPIQIRLVVSADAFEAIFRQAAEADRQQRTLEARVTLVGESLPEQVGDHGLKGLDVSEDRDYAVGCFDIETRPIERGPGEAYGASIEILITETRYGLNAAHPRAHSISCEGRVIRNRAKPYDGATVTVNFEHSSERYYELPEPSFFGEFEYLPEREPFPTGFKFNLWYASEDAWDLLVPLLTRGADTQVLLIVNLTNEETELVAATDELRGNVRDYSFKVSRKLID
jgi:hypothetical protein